MLQASNVLPGNTYHHRPDLESRIDLCLFYSLLNRRDCLGDVVVIAIAVVLAVIAFVVPLLLVSEQFDYLSQVPAAIWGKTPQGFVRIFPQDLFCPEIS